MADSLNLNATVGSLEIGLMLSIFLFGIVTIQTFIYYNGNSSADSSTLKTWIAIIWLLELAHTICFSHAVYTMTITDYGQLQALIQMPKTLYLSLTLSGIVGPLVQSLYAVRIRKLSGCLYIPILCWMLAFLHIVGNVSLTVTSLLSTSLVQLESGYSWLLTAILVVDATNDILIAASLCYFFFRERKTAIKRTARLLDLLILWTMQTGLLTCITTVAQLVLFLTMKRTLIWMAFFTAIAKFYSNSLLAALNGRRKLRNLDRNTITTGVPTEFQGGGQIAPISALHFAIEMSPAKSSTSMSDLQFSIPSIEQDKPKADLEISTI